jgi:hypothetical protein
MRSLWRAVDVVIVLFRAISGHAREILGWNISEQLLDHLPDRPVGPLSSDKLFFAHRHRCVPVFLVGDVTSGHLGISNELTYVASVLGRN